MLKLMPQISVSSLQLSWAYIPFIATFLINPCFNAIILEGMTAVMSATLNNHKHIIRYLLAQGADATIQNDHGGTALSIAKIKESKEIIHMLEPYFGPDASTDPHLIILEHIVEMITMTFTRILANVRYYTGLQPTKDMSFEDL